MRKLIIGDIHGNFDKLIDVLTEANYNKDNDVLYSVGDLCDRGTQNLKVLEWVMQNDVKMVVGNHDLWLQNYLFSGHPSMHWLFTNGGTFTYKEVKNLEENKKLEIAEFLKSKPYLIEEDNFIIVHGGFPSTVEKYEDLNFFRNERPTIDIFADADYENLTWDRSYFSSAILDAEWENNNPKRASLRNPIDFDKWVFVGHTPLASKVPFINQKYKIIAIDTGAAYSGPLTIMDMNTHEYWQSSIKEENK